jgi:hypothetical protein
MVEIGRFCNILIFNDLNIDAESGQRDAETFLSHAETFLSLFDHFPSL